MILSIFAKFEPIGNLCILAPSPVFLWTGSSQYEAIEKCSDLADVGSFLFLQDHTIDEPQAQYDFGMISG